MARTPNPMEMDAAGNPYQGSLLRQLRAEAGISIRELAEYLERDPATLSKIENNRARPSIHLLDRAAAKLGIPVEQLLSSNLHPRLASSPTRSEAASKSESLVVSELLHRNRLGMLRNEADIEEFWRTGMISHAFPSRPARIDQAADVAEQALALLYLAANQPPSATNEIVISLLSRDVFSLTPGLRRDWQRVLRAVHYKGWNVVHVIRLDKSVDDLFTLVTETLDLLLEFNANGAMTARYEPLAVTCVKDRFDTSNLVFVPNIGVLLTKINCHSDEIEWEIAKSGTRSYRAAQHTARQLKREGKPFLEIYREADNPQLLTKLTYLESQAGATWLLMGGPSERTAPSEVDQARAQQVTPYSAADSRDLPYTLNLRDMRRRFFTEQLKRWPYYDVYAKAALEKLALFGAYPNDDSLSLRGAPPSSSYHRRLHIQNLIRLVRDEPNYYLGLLDETIAPRMVHPLVLAKEGEAVFMEASRLTARGELVERSVIINNPHVADSMVRYLSSLWNDLDSKLLLTDRPVVIRWLEALLELVPGDD